MPNAHHKWKSRRAKGSLYRPSNPKTTPGPKIMKGLGFKEAHPVEGKAYRHTGQGTSAVKQFAQRHAGKLAKVMTGAQLGMRALGRASAAGAAIIGAHDIAVAGREGMKALKAHSDAKMNAKAQKRKYGTVAAATRTRHDLNKKKSSQS